MELTLVLNIDLNLSLPSIIQIHYIKLNDVIRVYSLGISILVLLLLHSVNNLNVELKINKNVFNDSIHLANVV